MPHSYFVVVRWRLEVPIVPDKLMGPERGCFLSPNSSTTITVVKHISSIYISSSSSFFYFSSCMRVTTTVCLFT